jgi:hypothetical protein
MDAESMLPDFERCDGFWRRQDVDRPLLAGWVGTYQAPDLYPNGMSRLPEGKLEPADVRFDLFRPDYEMLYERHWRTGADVPWAAFPVMPLPWMEAIIGCPIYHRGGNIWAEPWLDSYDSLEQDGLRLDEAWLDRLVEFTRWLAHLSDGRFPVALSLMRGPADLLAAMRGAERSIYDLVDHPGGVRKTLGILTDAWIQVARAQLAQIPGFAGGYGFSVQYLWARQAGGWFQDDAVAFWSPTFYRRYLLQCEARLSTCMPVTGIHLHPVSLFVVDDLVDVAGLDVIEVNLDDVGPRVQEMMPQFRRILEKKRLMVWGELTVEDLRAMRESLPTGGLALQLMAETPERVRALIGQVKAIWCG